MSKKPNQAPIEVCFADTGGTFTDVFLVDANGEFISAKASSTPDDLTRGYLEAVTIAAQKRGLSLEAFYSHVSLVGYGTTMAVNTLLNRRGAKVGIILTKGFETLMLVGRAKQSWLGYDIYDIIHARTHRRDEPLVPRSNIKGVTERVNSLGEAVIPLYENEVGQAANELLSAGVEAIAICFLFSFLNPVHEKRAREIVYDAGKKMGKEIHVYTSNDVCPVYRELTRLNTTVAEAYTGASMAKSIRNTEANLKKLGYRGSLQIMQASGGMASLENLKMVDTINSGPVGGLVGGHYISKVYGFDNVITTDVGGTSFDVGLITDGTILYEREPTVARMVLGMPVAEINSIGAGGGTYVFLDRLTNRLQIGPGSAEAVPGPICYDRGGEIPTITDCDLILGYIDPEYFLGGTSKLKINKEKATRLLKERVADPLKMDVAEVARGAKELLDNRMRDTIIGMVMSRGYNLSEYYLLGFGGAGPTHVAGYTEGLQLKGTMIFPYSAVFSAFGAATANFQHNYFKATNIIVSPTRNDVMIERICQQLNEGWQSLENSAYTQMEREGFQKSQIQLQQLVMIRYGRQLDDLIVPAPKPRLNSTRDWDELIAAFEKMYERIYAASAKYPQSGYEILQMGLIATVEKIKPSLKRFPQEGKAPVKKAMKGRRDCYFDKWTETAIYDWDELRAGNSFSGPAIVEGPSSNLVLPPGRSVRIDEYLTVWLS